MVGDKQLSLRTIEYRAQQINKDRRLAIDYWHEKGLSENELLKVHKALAKRSNQRLVRLEKAISKVTGESFDTFGAGDIAKQYLQNRGVKGKLRFTENAKSNYLLPIEEQTDNQKFDRIAILKDIKEMQKFLLSPSSTVQHQKAIEKKRLETFETDIYDEEGELVRKAVHFADNKEFYDFLNSQTYKELMTTFKSETIVEVYDSARVKGDSHNDIVDALADYSKTEKQSVKGLRDTLGLKEI